MVISFCTTVLAVQKKINTSVTKITYKQWSACWPRFGNIIIISASTWALSLIFMRNIPGTYKQFLCNCVEIQKSVQRFLAANDVKSIAVQQLSHVRKLWSNRHKVCQRAWISGWSRTWFTICYDFIIRNILEINNNTINI